MAIDDEQSEAAGISTRGGYISCQRTSGFQGRCLLAEILQVVLGIGSDSAKERVCCNLDERLVRTNRVRVQRLRHEFALAAKPVAVTREGDLSEEREGSAWRAQTTSAYCKRTILSQPHLCDEREREHDTSRFKRLRGYGHFTSHNERGFVGVNRTSLLHQLDCGLERVQEDESLSEHMDVDDLALFPPRTTPRQLADPGGFDDNCGERTKLVRPTCGAHPELDGGSNPRRCR